MRNRVTVLLAVAAALALVSCAGLGPAAEPAADLYDMDSYLVALGRLVNAPADASALPLPPVSDTPVRASSPAPSEIGIVSRPDAASPVPPIALPAPIPPAAPAARTTAPRPAAAAPAATPAAPPASSAAAVAKAAPAASVPQAAAPSGAFPAKKIREVYARVGDEIEIGLDGVGFLFLGFADRQNDSMTFKARTVKDGRTFFTFKALKLGTWALDFQQQDNASGASRIESVQVVVLEEADFASAVQRQTAGGGEAAPESFEAGRFEWAEKLVALGKENAAIAEYLKGYREGNPDLNDRIATLYARTGNAEAAGKYWRRNVGAATPWSDRAVVGLARAAVVQGDLDGYLAWHRQLLAVSAVAIDDVLVDAALAASAKGEVGLGIDLLSEYGRRYPEGKRMDEAAFVTARLLEAESPFRDLKRSRDLYAALLREFPESAHAEEAVARLQYLDQHFFTIR